MITIIIIIFLLIAPFLLKGGWILGIPVYGMLFIFIINCIFNKNNITVEPKNRKASQKEYEIEPKIIYEINQKFKFNYETDMYLGEVLKNIYERNIDSFYEIWEYIIYRYHSYQNDYFIGTSLGEYILRVINNNTYIFQKMIRNPNLVCLLYKENGYIDYIFFNYLEYLIEEKEYETFENTVNFLYQNETYKKISRDVSQSKLTEELIESLKYNIDDNVYKILEKRIYNMSSTNYNKFKNVLDKYRNKKENEAKIDNIELINEDYIIVLISKECIPKEIKNYTIKETPKEICQKIINDSKKIKLYVDMIEEMKDIQLLKFSNLYKSDIEFYFRNVNCILYYLHGNNIIGSVPKNDQYEDDYNYNICNSAYEDYFIPNEQLNKIQNRLNLKDENIIDYLKLNKNEIDYIKKELGISNLEQYTIIRNDLIIIKKFPIKYKSISKIKEKLKKIRLISYIYYIHSEYGYDFSTNFYIPNKDFAYNMLPEKMDNAIYCKDLNMYVMSNWEANIIRILEFLNINYTYEKEEIKLKNGSYFPDITLDDGTVLEVKGFWDKRSLEKCYEYAKINSKYYIIDSDMYYNLQEIYAEKINNWVYSSKKNQVNLVEVVNINTKNRKKYIEEIQKGDEVCLKLDKKNNKVVIRVLNIRGECIGNLSEKWANIYIPKIKLGMQFKSILESKNDKCLIIKVYKEKEDNIIYDFLQNKNYNNV